MYKRKASDKQIDEVIYKAEHDGFGLNEDELDAYMAEYPFGNGANPIGTIIAFMGNTPPNGYLTCDGTEYNIIDYPKLAKFFNDQFGSVNHFGGDGTDTFCVPDLRGEFLRGTGTNSRTTQGSGANVGVHQDATRQANTYTYGKTTQDYWVGGLTLSNGSTSLQNIDASDNNSYSIAFAKVSQNTASNYKNGITRYTARPTNTSVLYCIKADTITIEELNDTYLLGYDKYSTDEQVVGCWTNGKPLYQKTFVITMPNCTANGTMATKTVDHNIANVDEIFVYDCYANDTFGSIIPMPYITNDGYQIKIWLIPESVINLNLSCKNYANQPCIATLRYTKTTDPENSFNITQLSNFKKVTNDANNYSLEEKLIGTWVDGKPLYQKTYKITAGSTTTSGTDVTVTETIDSSFVLIDISGIVSFPYSSAIQSRPINGYIAPTSTSLQTVMTWISDNKIYIRHNQVACNGATCYITLKYIKTIGT